MRWDDPVTENPALGATEIWEIHNLTKDAHPIHIHEVQFQVLDRQRAGRAARPAEPWERGFKDTAVAYPGFVTRLKATFDRAGRYVWHCHMLEHEDNEMMHPYTVG
ncbi:multicopper oxidase domain-containing protein [Streptomyces atratus]|uniref:multicopper oxidase domain-containing protein n=1 Tax=Streptomyces atratus TaxID=1893 RepID=UPI0036489522